MRSFLTFSHDAVEWAGLMTRPPYFCGHKGRSSRAQKLGIKYEAQAQGYLLELFPDTYVPSPWVAFRLRHEPMLKYCQPDGLVVDIQASRITIVEIKYRHMAEAYVQLTGIYDPVVKKLFPGWDIRHVEVVRWYDPGTSFPVSVQMLSCVELAAKGRFGVHIWNP